MILQIPFTSFSILFTRAVQLCDLDDLALLERFAASLQPTSVKDDDAPDSALHPHHLYQLLCQAGRLYIESFMQTAMEFDPNPSVASSFRTGSADLLFSDANVDTIGTECSADFDDVQVSQLSDWFYRNQQMMTLLDSDYLVSL